MKVNHAETEDVGEVLQLPLLDLLVKMETRTIYAEEEIIIKTLTVAQIPTKVLTGAQIPTKIPVVVQIPAKIQTVVQIPAVVDRALLAEVDGQIPR